MKTLNLTMSEAAERWLKYGSDYPVVPVSEISEEYPDNVDFDDYDDCVEFAYHGRRAQFLL